MLDVLSTIFFYVFFLLVFIFIGVITLPLCIIGVIFGGVCISTPAWAQVGKMLLPLGILVAAIVVVIMAAVAIWLRKDIAQLIHYLFVPHPASRSLQRPGPIDPKELGESLRRTSKEPPPTYVSENMRQKAKAHADRLRAETELIKQAIERERARARYDEERKQRR